MDRLSLAPDGQVRLELLRPWPGPGGRTAITLDPVALLRRIAALVPAPYQNMLHYHGVFANRSKLRPQLPKPPLRIWYDPAVAAQQANPKGAAYNPTDDSPDRPRRLGWAKLLRRVLDVDALSCARCATPMVVLSYASCIPCSPHDAIGAASASRYGGGHWRLFRVPHRPVRGPQDP